MCLTIFLINEHDSYERHPASAMFPDKSPEEHADFVNDIKKNGFLVPALVSDKKVIDGYHRIQAGKELDLPVPAIEWDGQGSPVAMAISLNIHRRQLTDTQRIITAVETAEQLAIEAKARQGKRIESTENVPECFGESREQAARLCGTNSNYVQLAIKLKKEHPDLYTRLRLQKITLQEAKKLSKMPEKEREDILIMVDSGQAGTVNQAIKLSKPDTVQIETADLDGQLSNQVLPSQNLEWEPFLNEETAIDWLLRHTQTKPNFQSRLKAFLQSA